MVRIGLIVTLIAYALLMATYFAPGINHPDANGYWAQGSLIAKTGHSWFTPENDAQYVGMHWLLAGDEVYVSRYPPGLAVLIAGVYRILGWQATVMINPALALLTLIGVYLITSRLISPAWGLVACIALAINSAFAVHALTAISHVPVAACLVWGIYFLLRWSESGKIGFAFAAGLVLGCIPTIRYADAIVAIGVIVFLLMHARRFERIWRHYAAAAAGVAIAVIPLLIRNQLLFGAFWRTGYSLTNEQSGFGWYYFTQHALGYLQMLQGNGLGMIFALGVIGLAWMIATARDRAMGLMLLGAIAPLLIVYMAYYWAMGVGGGMGGPGGGGGGAGAMRFLVPIVPLFAIAAAWAMARATQAAPVSVRLIVPVVVLGMQLLMYAPAMGAELGRMKRTEVPLAIATRGLEKAAAEGDVVIASNALLQHLDFVRKWRLADVSMVRGRGGGGMGGPPGAGGFGERGRTDGFGPPPRFDGPGGGPGGGPPGEALDGDDEDRPSPMQQAKMEMRAKLYPGSADEREEKFLADVQAWAEGGPVYAIGGASEINNLLPGVAKREIEIVARLATPAAPAGAERAETFQRQRGQMPGRLGNPRGPMARGGGPGGPMGMGISPGEEIVIARWTPGRVKISSRPTDQ